MLPYNWMMGVAILLPVVAAILVYVIRQYQVRGVIVILAAIALIVNSVFFLVHGADKFTPANAGHVGHGGHGTRLPDPVVLHLRGYFAEELARADLCPDSDRAAGLV